MKSNRSRQHVVARVTFCHLTVLRVRFPMSLAETSAAKNLRRVSYTTAASNVGSMASCRDRRHPKVTLFAPKLTLTRVLRPEGQLTCLPVRGQTRSATWPIRVLPQTASGPAQRTVPTSPPKWSGGDLRTSRSVPLGLENLRPRSDRRAEALHSHFVARCRSIGPARRSRPPATSCTGLPHRPPKMLAHRLGCHSE